MVGSKTGFTDESRCVLVTCAERNGMRLIAVVMQEENPYQYDDTNTLLDYGFSNFDRVKVSDYETKYIITDETFFHSDSSVFGDSSSILSLDNDAYITLPKTTSFNNLTSTLTLNKEAGSDTIATITYRYNNVFLGNADILFSQKAETSFVFDETEPEIVDEEAEEKEPVFIYINYIIYAIIGLFVLVVIIAVLHKILATYHFAERRKA
ncbi:MAG: D-alanyl-D-alanine carboxypeptidase, partial [Lachnospiraceae bacterium]|nr:D-alanyl-D-alanine carboxypeptidase [Lachnospiraceae bacterium]